MINTVQNFKCFPLLSLSQNLFSSIGNMIRFFAFSAFFAIWAFFAIFAFFTLFFKMMFSHVRFFFKMRIRRCTQYPSMGASCVTMKHKRRGMGCCPALGSSHGAHCRRTLRSTGDGASSSGLKRSRFCPWGCKKGEKTGAPHSPYHAKKKPVQ